MVFVRSEVSRPCIADPLRKNDIINKLVPNKQNNKRVQSINQAKNSRTHFPAVLKTILTKEQDLFGFVLKRVYAFA